MAYLHAVAWLTDENEDYWMASVLCICVIKNCYELNVTRMSFGPLQMQIKRQGGGTVVSDARTRLAHVMGRETDLTLARLVLYPGSVLSLATRQSHYVH